MNIRAMDKLIEHYNKYFGQDDCMVCHPESDDGYHIDLLVYPPNEKYPFWKLSTMGASDYKMPKCEVTLGRYNEYIMFVDKDTDLSSMQILDWYRSNLLMVAAFAYYNKVHITYSHSFEWENEDEDDEMIAAFIEMPQIIEDSGILRCKTGIFKTVTCLQVVLLTRPELELLFEIGPEKFSLYLYPEEDGEVHFLTERHRSAKF